MNVKLFSILTVLLLVSCAREEPAQVEPQQDTQFPATLLEATENAEATYLEPIGLSSNSRSAFHQARFRFADWYKIKFEYQNSSGTWVSLHPGQSYVTTKDIYIPLTFPTYCGRRNIRTTSIFTGNPACMGFSVSVAGEWNGVCQNPPYPYIDIDYDYMVAYISGFNFATATPSCFDENFIIESMGCGSSLNNYCN